VGGVHLGAINWIGNPLLHQSIGSYNSNNRLKPAGDLKFSSTFSHINEGGPSLSSKNQQYTKRELASLAPKASPPRDRKKSLFKKF